MRLSEAFSEYRRVEIQGRGCSLKTDENIKCAGSVACQFFGDINVKRITAAGVSDFYLDLTSNICRNTGKARIVSQNTARGYVMTLRAVIRFCYKRGLKTINPSEIIVPKREKKKARYIEIEQYEALLKEVSTSRKGYAKINRVRNTLIVKMLFHTGLRVGELCALNRDSIYNREFSVIGKSKEPRPCFITREIEKDIKEYLDLRGDDNPALFIANENGERITTGGVQRIFRLATRRIGLVKVTPHTMRHSFATMLINDGVDIRYVADLLGHQDLNTTKQYTHIKDCKLRKIYENLMESC